MNERIYVEVASFALGDVLRALRNESNVTVSLQDGNLLVAFDYTKTVKGETVCKSC